MEMSYSFGRLALTLIVCCQFHSSNFFSDPGSDPFAREIWMNADWNKDNKSLLYLSNTMIRGEDGEEKKDMRVLSTSFLKDESSVAKLETSYKGGLVYVTYTTKQLFGVTKAVDGIKAIAVCRVPPLVSTGVKKLNTIFDPSKTSERKRKEELAKKQYHESFGQLNLTKAYEKIFELFWYSRLPCFDVKDISKEKDDMSVIKRCYWRGAMVDCSLIFVTRPTDRGMCCSFNVENAEKIFKKTRYGSVTSELERRDKNKSFGGVVNR